MLTYQETIWKEESGYKTKKVQLRIDSIQAINTIKDQNASVEKISLVAYLSKEQKKILLNASRQLKRNDRDFYPNNNLHVTVLGFGPIKRTYYGTIEKRIKEFSKGNQKLKLTVTFDTIRPGSFYLNARRIDPINGLSNGTVIALGDIKTNKEFHNYSNQLSSFLSKDNKLKPVLQSYFRKKLPSVWCTMGYYNKPGTFKISQELEGLFKQYYKLAENCFRFSITEIFLVKSNHKNLKYSTVLHTFKV